MSSKLKAILAFAVLTMSLGTLSSAQAGKLLTVPDQDWTGAIVTERTIQIQKAYYAWRSWGLGSHARG